MSHRRTASPFLALVALLVLAKAQTHAAGEGTHAHALNTLATGADLLPADGSPVKCGLPVLSYGRQHRAEGATQSLLGILDVRPTAQTSILAGMFRIHYDTTGPNTPALLDPAHLTRLPGTARQFVDSVGVSAAYVYQVEVDSLGYSPPPPDQMGGGPEFDIYVVELGGVYGYVAPDSNAMPEGGRSPSFMVIDNDFIFLRDTVNRGIPAMNVTLAHEFHHAVQIGGYGYWATEVYFHEITSTWLEDVAYPAVNDYLQYVWSSEGEFAQPDVPFTSNGLIMYSRAVWGHFVAKRFGADAMRHCWEQARTVRPTLAIDNAFKAFHNSTLATSFGDWTLWNYFTGSRSDSTQYYPEGSLYRLVTQRPCTYANVPRSIPDSLAPLSARYLQVIGASKPLTLIASNIDATSAFAGSTAREAFAFFLRPSSIDNSYRSTAAGVYFKLESANPSHWWSWDVVNGIVGNQPFNEETPFPNPFFADGASRVYIPSFAVTGTLSVYTSSMRLVYQGDQASVLRLGRRVFSWDGRTSEGETAATGVYLYVLSLSDHTVTGKIAVVRR